MLPLFSLKYTRKYTQRNVVPNRAAQGALMSVFLGMLSSPLPPLYSSLSIPLSFFLLFSLVSHSRQEHRAEWTSVQSKNVCFSIVKAQEEKKKIMCHDDNSTILLQTCYRWKYDTVFLLINLLCVWKKVYLKMKILSSFTPHNCMTFFGGTEKYILKNVSVKSKLVGYQHSSKYLLYSTEERNT